VARPGIGRRNDSFSNVGQMLAPEEAKARKGWLEAHHFETSTSPRGLL
jgi:hypothetical protein